MKSSEITRRQFLKTTGALVVSFNLFCPARKALAQFATLPSGDIDPTSLDSWLAITPDGLVTFYTSKVELGTGTITALAQIVAEELDVPFAKIKMVQGDTSTSIEQGSTVGSRTIERAGPQVRQAAAAARQELLKLAAARLNAPVEKLTVTEGVVSVAGDAGKESFLRPADRRQKIQHQDQRQRHRLGHESRAGGEGQGPQAIQSRRPVGQTHRVAGQSNR